MNEVLARVTINPEKRQIEDLLVHQKSLRFKCRRCATFCCRLGGPKLSRKDIEQIRRAGYPAKAFLEPVSDSEFKDPPVMEGCLKSKEDGSCIFLKFDEEEHCYECSIYDFRPVLCRLYPFDFDRVDSNIVILKFIPCCRGLNNPDGKLVDERFVADRILAPLLEVIELS